jgi:uncharacterized protein YcaQ
MQLTQAQARAVMLAAQGLHRRPRKKAAKGDVLRAIQRMGALQIDTIHVVARSPYLVLWSRLGDYETHWLDELLAEGKLFEYWSHEACFLPIEDYPLYRHRMLNASSQGWHYSPSWVQLHRQDMKRLLALIRERGPVRSADFARTDGKGGGWWEWKTEKRALEMLFTSGDLMVAWRQNFQRVYDLRERVLPSWHDRSLPPVEKVRRELALKGVRALGVTIPRWVADYFRTGKQEMFETVLALAREGALLMVQVEGWDGPALFHPENRRLIKEAASGRIKPELTILLSPFDPLVWDRARARAVFGFDYRLECYTPAPKRRYGYFALPILRRGELVGRLDAKAHRREGVFEVKSIYLEKSTVACDELISDVAGAIQECAGWHKTPVVTVRESGQPGVTQWLAKLVGR